MILGLNPEQQKAVETIQGPLMILAGAGTGKTRVITEKIHYMITRAAISPQNIGAMTFTNKAAREMKERLSQMLNPSICRKLTISTFHSFCLKLLRIYHKEAGLSDRFLIAGPQDQKDLVRKALEEKRWLGFYQPDQLLTQISYCKNQLLSFDDLDSFSSEKDFLDPQVVKPVYELYEKLLKLHEAIDFDDCIFKMYKILDQNLEVRGKIRKQFTHILVDEFQDTNGAQMGFLRLLVPPEGNLCVVGDDDQSIYSWRGALFETLEAFERYYPTSQMIKLEQNYRCTNRILQAANHVIRHNTKRKDKTLWAQTKEDEEPIHLECLENAEQEAQWVSQKIISLFGQGLGSKDIAILYRANNQAKLIEASLRQSHILYKTFGGDSFFERKEIRDFLSFFRLVIHPKDSIAFWRIINTPPRGIGLKTQEHIAHEAKSQSISPYFFLKTQLSLEQKPWVSHEGITSFIEKIEFLRKKPLSNPDDVEHLSLEIIRIFGLLEALRLECKTPSGFQHKKDLLLSMADILKKSVQEEFLQHQDSWDPYPVLDALTLGDQDPKYQDDKKDQDSQTVSLMTIHGSKGLEFPAVFLVGLEEGLLPHKNSLISEEAISEERRLFYVALTRAKKKLFLSYAQNRQTGFSSEKREPSRFLNELPDDTKNVFLEKKPKEQTQEERKEQTLSRISNLKKSFLE